MERQEARPLISLQQRNNPAPRRAGAAAVCRHGTPAGCTALVPQFARGADSGWIVVTSPCVMPECYRVWQWELWEHHLGEVILFMVTPTPTRGHRHKGQVTLRLHSSSEPPASSGCRKHYIQKLQRPTLLLVRSRAWTCTDHSFLFSTLLVPLNLP